MTERNDFGLKPGPLAKASEQTTLELSSPTAYTRIALRHLEPVRITLHVLHNRQNWRLTWELLGVLPDRPVDGFVDSGLRGSA